MTRAAALAAWAGFFAWLIATGERSRYLGPRTYWVVYVGGALLLLAAAAHLAPLVFDRNRRHIRRPVSIENRRRGEVVGLVVLVAPILAVLAVPAPQLGSLAASRKAAIGVSAAGVPAPPADSGDIGFREIQYAGESSSYAGEAGIAEGVPVTLQGFVREMRADELVLSRFYVSCCAADALPYSVRVVGDPATTAAVDEWLQVDGVIVRDGDGFAVDPRSIREIDEPRDPYLY